MRLFIPLIFVSKQTAEGYFTHDRLVAAFWQPLFIRHDCPYNLRAKQLLLKFALFFRTAFMWCSAIGKQKLH